MVDMGHRKELLATFAGEYELPVPSKSCCVLLTAL